jgi:GTP cyclohydrolase II
VKWGAATARERGPIVGTVTSAGERNAIGAHGGSYALYRALAVSSGALNPIARPDLTNTAPVVDVGPFPQWGVKADGDIVRAGGDIAVTKAAIDPVWYLPGIAERFKVTEDKLRRTLFEQTGGIYPELVTRPDLTTFLPPIGGITLYIFGDPAAIADRKRRLTCRVHDECNGSDVFGSDICTCRPYLIHGIAECVREAQNGGAGLIAYNRKEGRALGEVTKFLVYNARKRQEGGDQAATYFERTECVAGVQDARFQQLMPDVLHWLGITRIDRFVSMSNMKYDAIVETGIEIGERVAMPADLIPPDAQVEIEAKKAAGYYTPGEVPTTDALKTVVGRNLEEF